MGFMVQNSNEIHILTIIKCVLRNMLHDVFLKYFLIKNIIYIYIFFNF